MPRVYFVDNYSYELDEEGSLHVFKYDIFENTYYTIDTYSIQDIPKKYVSVMHDIQTMHTKPITSHALDIKVNDV